MVKFSNPNESTRFANAWSYALAFPPKGEALPMVPIPPRAPPPGSAERQLSPSATAPDRSPDLDPDPSPDPSTDPDPLSRAPPG